MNLALDDFQAELVATADAFLSDKLSSAGRRSLATNAATAIDAPTWQACAEMGWLMLLQEEGSGGLGLGMAEAVLLLREIGRHLLPGPWRSSVLAAALAATAGLEDLAPMLGSGARRTGLLVGDILVDAGPGDLVLAIDGEGAELLEVLTAEQIVAVDPGVRLWRPGRVSTLARDQSPLWRDRLRLLSAAELLGVIEAVRDMSASYAITREQFGKPIGVNQAVKHRCANMAIAAYATRAQVFMAAVRMDAGLSDAGFHAASAYSLAIDGSRRAAADNIQNHGGIAVTAEHDAHLYLKRAHLLEHVVGPRRENFASIIEPSRIAFA